MATDLIRYDLLVQDALRSVVRRVLADTARAGLPGDHHFNIAFKTQATGVIVPPAIKARFPDEMSIILQHEFWDLTVTPDAFEVSLNFSRKPERLTVPFDAITGFTDPSVPFGFKLEPRAYGGGAAAGTPSSATTGSHSSPAAKPAQSHVARPKTEPAKPTDVGEEAASGSETSGSGAGVAKIVSIDAFRKR